MKNKVKIIYLITIVVSVLIQFGCNSLTKRIWIENPMIVAAVEQNKSYFTIENTNEMYVRLEGNRIAKIDIPKGVGKLAIKILNGKRHLEGETILKIHDYSRVDPELRKKTYFDYVIFPQTRDYKDISIDAQSYLYKCSAEFVDKMPDNIQAAKNPYVPQIDVCYWENNRGLRAIIWRSIATPFTFVADIILVPFCYAYLVVDYITTPNLFR